MRHQSRASIDSPVLTFKEAMAYLKRGETWLRQHKAEIGYVGTGRPMFERAALDAWLARNRVAPEVEPERAPYQPKPLVFPGSTRINPLDNKPYGNGVAR